MEVGPAKLFYYGKLMVIQKSSRFEEKQKWKLVNLNAKALSNHNVK